MKLKEPARQKGESRNSCQQAKHARLPHNMLQAKQRESLTTLTPRYGRVGGGEGGGGVAFPSMVKPPLCSGSGGRGEMSEGRGGGDVLSNTAKVCLPI